MFQLKLFQGLLERGGIEANESFGAKMKQSDQVRRADSQMITKTLLSAFATGTSSA